MPNLTLKNEKDEDIQVADIASEKGAVVFLVPKADTREFFSVCKTVTDSPFLPIAGCTTQACGFRDIFDEFAAVNYSVYCLSADSPGAQTKWQSKVRPPPVSPYRTRRVILYPDFQKELPYSLISDPKRILITALGAGEGGKTKRSHFIFEKGGKLLEKKIPVKPGDRYDLPSLKLNPLTRLFSPNLALEFIKSTTASS